MNNLKIKTKTKKIKITLAIVATLVLVYLPFSAFSHGGYGVGGAQDELNAVNRRIAELSQEIELEKTTAKTLKDQMKLMDKQVQLLELSIEQLQKESIAIEGQITQTQEEIIRLKEEIDVKKKIVAEYVRSISGQDQRSFLELFITSENFSDFLVSESSLMTVQNNVQKILFELNDLQNKLNEDLIELEKHQTELDDKQNELLQKRKALIAQKTVKINLLKQTKGKESAYKLQLAAKRKKQAELYKLIIQEGGGNGNYVSAGTTAIFDFPIRHANVSQGYGFTDWAKEGHYGGGIHNGIDLAITSGEPIRAPADGTVYAKGKEQCGDGCRSAYGNWLILRHIYVSSDGASTITYYTVYAHMQSYSVATGTVKRGNVVGYVGSTGFSSGPHLHFTIFRKICSKVDTSCNPSLPVSKTGPMWYATNSVDPFDFLNPPPANIYCGSYTDWDSAYKHTNQCYRSP